MEEERKCNSRTDGTEYATATSRRRDATCIAVVVNGVLTIPKRACKILNGYYLSGKKLVKPLKKHHIERQ